MDADFLVKALNEFDELRISRVQVAQQFLAGYTSQEDLYADVANIFALMYAANKLSQMPQGFKSDTGG